jgi:hypothetical protein
MHRQAKVLLSSMVAGVLVALAYFQAPVLPFRTGVAVHGPNHTLTEAPLKKEEKQAVAAVLNSYSVRYVQTESSILITPCLFFDREMRWNYTSKAK